MTRLNVHSSNKIAIVIESGASYRDFASIELGLEIGSASGIKLSMQQGQIRGFGSILAQT